MIKVIEFFFPFLVGNIFLLVTLIFSCETPPQLIFAERGKLLHTCDADLPLQSAFVFNSLLVSTGILLALDIYTVAQDPPPWCKFGIYIEGDTYYCCALRVKV